MVDERKIEMTKEEEKAFSKGLSEVARLLDMGEKFDEKYKALNKKYPLKVKKGK